MSAAFLTTEEVRELTGVNTGRKGRTREQLQVAALTQMKIPHWVNMAGLPKVARAVIEGGRADGTEATWEPGLAAL
jgi:hypothetical protein